MIIGFAMMFTLIQLAILKIVQIIENFEWKEIGLFTQYEAQPVYTLKLFFKQYTLKPVLSSQSRVTSSDH